VVIIDDKVSRAERSRIREAFGASEFRVSVEGLVPQGNQLVRHGQGSEGEIRRAHLQHILRERQKERKKKKENKKKKRRKERMSERKETEHEEKSRQKEIENRRKTKRKRKRKKEKKKKDERKKPYSEFVGL
jgi:hypothetical protein